MHYLGSNKDLFSLDHFLKVMRTTVTDIIKKVNGISDKARLVQLLTNSLSAINSIIEQCPLKINKPIPKLETLKLIINTEIYSKNKNLKDYKEDELMYLFTQVFEKEPKNKNNTNYCILVTFVNKIDKKSSPKHFLIKVIFTEGTSSPLISYYKSPKDKLSSEELDHIDNKISYGVTGDYPLLIQLSQLFEINNNKEIIYKPDPKFIKKYSENIKDEFNISYGVEQIKPLSLQQSDSFISLTSGEKNINKESISKANKTHQIPPQLSSSQTILTHSTTTSSHQEANFQNIKQAQQPKPPTWGYSAQKEEGETPETNLASQTSHPTGDQEVPPDQKSRYSFTNIYHKWEKHPK
jgi:hypothetical protein